MPCNTLVILCLLVPFVLGQAIDICPTREVSLSSGQITSPNYPSNYPSNTDCTLTIKQPLDTNFTFTFTKIDIEGDEADGELQCYDNLVISGAISKEFCDTTTPAPFVPGLNVVRLQMRSDDSVEQSGFDLSFTTVQTTGLPPAVSVCPSRSITPNAIGRVHSPEFAGEYGNNLDCKLTLSVPPNKKVEVFYNYRDIQFSEGCASDILKVGDNTLSTQTCGTSKVPSSAKVYTDGDVWFHFTTDGSNSATGFMLTYKLLDKPVPSCSCPNGNSYIKRPIDKNNMIKRQNDDITLEFKTSQPNGLFLFGQGSVRDFILLKLENGNVVFEVDLGTGNITVPVPSASLDDNAWHKIVVERRSKNVKVTVDGLSEVTATTPGKYYLLDIKPGNGKTAAMYSFGGPSGIRYNVNFQGCVRNFEVDGMKPVEAYLTNDPDYTMYGSTSMGTC